MVNTAVVAGAACATVAEVLAQRAERTPERVAYRFLSEGGAAEATATYGEMDARARGIAAALRERGAVGEPVLILCPPGLDYVAALLGCLYAGAIAVPAYPPRGVAEERGLPRLRAIAADARPRAVLALGALVARAGQLAAAAPELLPPDWIAVDDPSAGEADGLVDAARQPDGVALLQYTSGSTASPKGVVLTHANVMANLGMIDRGFGHGEESVGVIWLPPYHDMGLVGGILQPLYRGFEVVLMAPVAFLQRPMLWPETVARYRGTTSGGPSFAYELCVQKSTPEERARLDLSSWDVAFCGAEPVRAATLRRFAEAFAPAGFRAGAFYACYGLAEATLIVTGGRKDDPPLELEFDRSRLASGQVVPVDADAPDAQTLVGCGAPIGQRVAIVDPDTRGECLPGRVGEVWIAGPNVAAGYWRQPELTAATFGARLATGEGPFLRTGDLGFRHGGELFVAGRIKDLIILRGRNLHPQDVEAAVEGCHPALRAGAAAFSVADEGGAERLVVAAEVGRSFREGDAEAVCDAVRAAVAEGLDARADTVLLLRHGGVPKTSSGKVRRAACREAYLEGALPLLAESRLDDTLEPSPEPAEAPAPSSPRAVVVAALREALAAALGVPAAGIDTAKPLTALGFDSLAVVELQVGIRKQLGVELALERIVRAGTVEGLADEIAAASAPAAPARPAARPHVFERARAFREADDLRRAGLMPYFREIERNDGATARIDGRDVLMLGSNNYLGLTTDPRVREAVARAAREEGPSLTGSRLANGSTARHRALELRLADFLGREDALVFTTGYQANVGLLSALLGEGATLLVDAHRHASIYDGALVSRCRLVQVGHNDVADLRAALAAADGPAMAMVDGVYSMGGDVAPLGALAEACRAENAVLAVDDAHGLGMLGPTGRGTEEAQGILGAADVLSGTFSKSLASVGGWVAAEAAVVEWIRFNARAMLFSASMPPPAVAAAATALEILIAEPWRVARVAENAAQWRDGLRRLGFDTGSSASAIVPVVVGDDHLCLRFARALLDAGVYVGPAVYPAVPRGAAMVRTSVVATHEPAQLDQALTIVGEVGAALGLIRR